MKVIRKINDEQFERLNWHEQKYYRFCQNCGMYRDIRDNEVCNCESKNEYKELDSFFNPKHCQGN